MQRFSGYSYFRSVSTGLAVVLFAATAHAQFNPRDERTGVQAAVYGGYGSFTNDGAFRPSNSTSNSPGLVHGSFGLQADIAYRVVPAFTAGVAGTFQVLSVDRQRAGLGDTGTASAAALALGVFVRVHPLSLLASTSRDPVLRRIEPFLGVGFNFIANANGSGSVGGFSANFWTNGVALPLTVGVDVQLNRNLYVGLLGEYAFWTSSGYCSQSGFGGTAFCDSPRDPEGYFFIGVGVRGHLHVLN